MQHFVLTRFNIAAGSLPHGSGLDRAWLSSRFQLFERFCLPAMRTQTASARWLVFFDARTPPELLDRINAYEPQVPGLEVVLVDGELSDIRIADLVRARLDEADGLLCTTRLDNDDAISRTFLARIQAAASRTDPPAFLNFPFGYQWHDGAVYLFAELRNPFVSFVERPVPGERPQTVMCDLAHHDIGRVAPVRQTLATAQWVQVIHEENVANVVRGVRRLRTTCPRGFAHDIVFGSRGDKLYTRLDEAISGLARISRVLWRRFFRALSFARDPPSSE